MDYEDIVREINKCPKTFLPALLITIAERCERENIFVEGGLLKVCGAVVEKIKSEKK